VLLLWRKSLVSFNTGVRYGPTFYKWRRLIEGEGNNGA
jgi:hypothetical protein